MSLENRRDYMARCTRCSHCKFVPTPTSQRFSSACPSIEYGKFHSYSGGGKLVTGHALLDGIIDMTPELTDSLYACTLCGACDTSCKVILGETVEPLDSLYEIRAHLAQTEQGPPEHRVMIFNLAKAGNVRGLPPGDRVAWAAGLELLTAPCAEADILLHVGSDAAYHSPSWPGMRAAVELMLAAGLRVAWYGAGETSSGNAAFELGYVNEAREYAERFKHQLEKGKAPLCVTFSAAAYAVTRNIYPRLGVSIANVQVMHITTWLANRREMQGSFRGEASQLRATYHDPCRLGRLSEPYTARSANLKRVEGGIYASTEPETLRFGNGGEYTAPRELLKTVVGLELVEMERNRASSYCCGAGGGAKEANPDFADFAATRRLEEAMATGADILVTSCSACACHLNAEAVRQELPIRVVDLLSLLAESKQAAQGVYVGGVHEFGK